MKRSSLAWYVGGGLLWWQSLRRFCSAGGFSDDGESKSCSSYSDGSAGSINSTD